MKTLTLSNLIGQEIADLKYHYLAENEFGLQSFHSFIKLSSGTIIDIPKFDNDDYLLLNEENLNYFQNKFNTGDSVLHNSKKHLSGQKITDLYFSYHENEIDLDRSAYIQLSNGYYLTENNYGPAGLIPLDLVILNAEDFAEQAAGSDIRSFLKTK
ncbi:MAG: hypothetical protein JWM14_3387 [Chitinophagaceae bacterium]|nr:hypothetical protein [Chitinophagaceae bacterium]